MTKTRPAPPQSAPPGPGPQSVPRRPHAQLPEEVVDRILTKAELGQFVRNRRESHRLSGAALADAIGWGREGRQRIQNLEKGSTVSRDLAAWIRMADVFDLSRRQLLGRAWDAAGGLTLELPPEGDKRRAVILDYVIERFGETNPIAVD